MSVHHCPVCPLIFEYRSEVEWHMRNEHRSRADEEHQLREELSAEGGDFDEARVRSLEKTRADAVISLLMPTTAAPAMTRLDVAHLHHLAKLARRRLSNESGVKSAPSLEHRLARAVAAAEGRSTDRGLAVLVSTRELAILRLPFGPRSRALVDTGFATRDLRYALQHHPLYRVLLLGSKPRALEGRGRHLVEVTGPGQGPGGRSIRFWRWTIPMGRQSAGWRHADLLLDHCSELAGPMPLVVVGGDRQRSAFRQLSAHAHTIVAEVQGTMDRASIAEVAGVSEPAIAAWREAEERARGIPVDTRADGRDEAVGPALAALEASGPRS